MFKPEYLSPGGNRDSAAADWSVDSNIIAYGAAQNVAVWRPVHHEHAGVFSLLKGHTAKVTALCFSYLYPSSDDEVIISGDAEGQVLIHKVPVKESTWTCTAQTDAHKGAINCISSLNQNPIFATGGAHAVIRVWRRRDHGLDLLSTITTNPRFIPLSLVIGVFVESNCPTSR